MLKHAFSPEEDAICIAEWKRLIKSFNDLVATAPAPKTIEKELIKIKEETKANPHLTIRQVDALYARVDNYLSGNYGNTKSSEQMNQTKTGFAKKD